MLNRGSHVQACRSQRTWRHWQRQPLQARALAGLPYRTEHVAYERNEPTMDIGLTLPNRGVLLGATTPDQMLDLAEAADRSGLVPIGLGRRQPAG